MGIEELLYANLILFFGASWFWYEWRKEKIDFLKNKSENSSGSYFYTPFREDNSWHSGDNTIRYWCMIFFFLTTAPIFIYKGLQKLSLQVTLELEFGWGLIILGSLLMLSIHVFRGKEPETVEEQIVRIKKSYRQMLIGTLVASSIITGILILFLIYE